MTKRDNAFLFRDVFAIDPGYNQENGTGYAIFDDKTHRLKACGLIRPFAPGIDNHATTIEIAHKVRRKWEKEVGFSYDPKVICIEQPIIYPDQQQRSFNLKSFVTLTVICTRIEERFSAKTKLRPYPHTWERYAPQKNKELILSSLGEWSLKTLKEELSSIPSHLQLNVFNAIGLGLWAISNKAHLSKAAKEKVTAGL